MSIKLMHLDSGSFPCLAKSLLVFSLLVLHFPFCLYLRLNSSYDMCFGTFSVFGSLCMGITLRHPGVSLSEHLCLGLLVNCVFLLWNPTFLLVGLDLQPSPALRCLV